QKRQRKDAEKSADPLQLSTQKDAEKQVIPDSDKPTTELKQVPSALIPRQLRRGNKRQKSDDSFQSHTPSAEEPRAPPKSHRGRKRKAEDDPDEKRPLKLRRVFSEERTKPETP